MDLSRGIRPVDSLEFSRSLFEWEIDDFIQGKRRRALIFRYYYRGWIWALVAMDSFDIKFPVESVAPRRVTE